MKTTIFLIPLLFLFILITASMPEPSNPPTGNTGAPGETTCMISGCHNGGNFTGTVNISGIPDTVFVNQTYDITLTNRSNAVRSGFQLTVLDAMNKFTGTLIQATGVNIAKDNSNGRTYARQSAAKFLTNGEVSWDFKWKAPASVTDENLTFYFTSMCANGDGNNGKDNSIRNIRKTVLKMPTSNEDINIAAGTPVLWIQKGTLFIQDEQNRIPESLMISNLRGQVVFAIDVLESNQIQVPLYPSDIYLIQFKLGDRNYTQKILFP